MSNSQPQSTFPPTLVFNTLDGFLDALQQRAIAEVGCAALKRIMPYEGGMMERHTSYLLLTARDHTRDEILVCSVFLRAGDFIDDQLFTPAERWKEQHERARRVEQQVWHRLHAVSSLRILDAAYHVHPDVCLRFASMLLPETDDGAGQCST